MYVISNPAFPDHIKIGTTSNLARRLSCYQTHCPHRGYKVEVAFTLANRKPVEKALHRILAPYREGNTEWFRVDAATAVRILTDLSHAETILAKELA